MPRAAYQRYVGPARARPQLWRLFAGLVVVAAVYTLGVIVIFGAGIVLRGVPGGIHWAEQTVRAETAVDTLILLATFSGLFLGPIVAVRMLHKRKAATLFGPRVRVLRDFVVSAGIVGTILGGSLIVWTVFNDPEPNLNLGLWLLLLPVSMLGLAVQTGAEELVFRGYFLQQMAARFRSPVAWMIFPSVVFGLLHYDPATAGQNVWLLVGAATMFGLIASDLVANSGNLGAAWGFHFANNFVAVLIIATKGTIPGLALYLTPYAADDANAVSQLIFVDLAVLLLCWWLVRRATAR